MDKAEGLRAVLQERFMDEHHHLISPWMYSEAECKARNARLLARNWDKNTPR